MLTNPAKRKPAAKPRRRKNPEIHVDINSHNFADNPAAVVDAVNRLSQRPHKTKSGAVTKKPDARLKSRRAKNTKKGFYPNPTIPAKSAKMYRVVLDNAITAAKEKTGDQILRQARVSYAQGLLFGAEVIGIVTADERADIMVSIRIAQGLK